MIRMGALIVICLIAVFLGGCRGPLVRDTMSVTLTWDCSGYDGDCDCDLGIWEANNNIYWIKDNYSPNGLFSNDMKHGGPETWNLSYYHMNGLYTPIVKSLNYTGSITITVRVNGVEAFATEFIDPLDQLAFMNWSITRAGTRNELSYDLNRVKLEDAGESPAALAE